LEEAVDDADEPWLARARQAGDICSSMPASPLKIYAVIDERIIDAGKFGPEVLQRARCALDFMQYPATQLVVDNGAPVDHHTEHFDSHNV
jgi:hypothetical protein